MDMSQFIAPKSDQLNADDLIAGPRTITIARVSGSDSPDQPVNIYYEGDNGKPYKPCKSMRRVMVALWGKDASQYVGRSMTIYRDPEVQFGGMKVGGIRISHITHIDEPKQMALTATRGKRAPYKVLPLKDAPQAEKPGSTITTEDFRRRLADAAERGMQALETTWRATATAPLREHVDNAELEGLKQRAREIDSVARDSFDQAQPEGANYDGV